MRKIFLMLLVLMTFVSFAAASQKMTVLLDGIPNTNHSPLIVAISQGYFKEQGLEVSLLSPADPKDTPAAIVANKADIGITWQPEYMQQVDAGSPLISIGSLIDKPLTSLVALNDNNIHSINDFRGKRIGASTNGLSEIMLKHMLSVTGMSEKDVQIKKIGLNSAEALVSHQVDIVSGIRRNVDIPLIEAGDKKVVTFFPEDHGVPTYNELVYIINIKNIKDNRYPRFLAALKKAVRYMDEHPQLAWQTYIRQYPAANNESNRQALFATLPYFSEDPGNFDGKEWHQFGEFMQKNKLIKKVQDEKRYGVILR